MIIVGVMCFFIYIILADLYKVLKLHSLQNEDSLQMFSPKKSSKRPGVYNDDNDFELDFSVTETNRSKDILVGLNKAQTSLYNNLDGLRTFIAENNLKEVEIDVSEKNINSENDDWDYPTKRRDSSFWNMIFDKPRHHSIVNNGGAAYMSTI